MKSYNSYISWQFVLLQDNCMEIHLFKAGLDTNVIIDLDDDYDDVPMLCRNIQEFLNSYANDKKLRIEIKNDGDMLGIIVDVWHKDECIDTATFTFENYEKIK